MTTVYFGDKTTAELKKIISNYKKSSSIFILSDENTFKNCLPIVFKKIPELKKSVVIKIKSGEENKIIKTCESIWKTLTNNHADRKSLLINLGGGMIGDLGGFAASAYMRGIDFINIPTTLLAMADASIGGKVGVNFNHYKNHIGFFNQAKAVFIYPQLLKTLPKRELLSGSAEMMKHGLIADKKYWSALVHLKTVDYKSIEKLIPKSVSIKNKIVKNDPSEQGERKKLNFGHTIGHAIESYSLKYDAINLLHGEAIAIGIICESYLSHKINTLSKNELNDITTFILSNFNPYKINSFTEQEIIRLVQFDKKNRNKKNNFTLIKNIGNAVTDVYCNDKLIKEALNYYKLLC